MQTSTQLKPLLGALDQAQAPSAAVTLQAAMDLADRIQTHALEEGRSLSRDQALVLAGQQMDQPASAPQPRRWTFDELEALYPAGVPRWKRSAGRWGFVGLLYGMLGSIMALANVIVSPSVGSIGLLAAIIFGMAGLTRVAGMAHETDEAFVENLRQVDSESLIRWYQSNTCISYSVVYGVLHERGIRLRP